MKGGLYTSGFTIVETMIVLAVTTVLLLSAMLALSGKTSQRQFAQAVNDVTTNLQQILNSSSNGNYPSRGNFSCIIDGSGFISINITPNSQGANLGCTFLGRMVNFNQTAGSPRHNYNIYTIVGKQCDGTPSLDYIMNGCSIPSLANSDPYLLSLQTGTQVSHALYGGLSLNNIVLKTTSGSSPPFSASGLLPSIAFLANPNTNALNNSNILSPGALQLGLYSYNCLPPVGGGSLLEMGGMGPCQLSSDNEIDVCFSSTTNNQSADIILNGTGYEATVSSKIFAGPSC